MSNDGIERNIRRTKMNPQTVKSVPAPAAPGGSPAFALPALPYAPEALEPSISARNTILSPAAQRTTMPSGTIG